MAGIWGRDYDSRCMKALDSQARQIMNGESSGDLWRYPVSNKRKTEQKQTRSRSVSQMSRHITTTPPYSAHFREQKEDWRNMTVLDHQRSKRRSASIAPAMYTGPRSNQPGYNESHHHYTATTRPAHLVTLTLTLTLTPPIL